jgi:hypothetical protein
MSKLVDPSICPDCRAPLDTVGTCSGCGLRLVGPAAGDLWAHMQQADRIIEALRTASVGPVAAPVPAAVPSAVTGLPAAPPVPPGAPPARRALPSASVPLVLLTLGGLCLLVAAIVFVAVAWSSLGLAAKTAIMLVVTALFGVGAVAVTRRDLRFAAETLWVVVAGMAALDFAAAYGADLAGLSRIGDRHAVGLVGAILLGAAVAVGAWATTTVLGRVHAMVGVAGIGTALLAGAEAWSSPHNPGAVAVSVPVLVGLAWAVDRLTDRHLRAIAAVLGGAAVVSWFVLVGHGLDRMATTNGDARWWSDFSGWPLLAAAALAAVLALAPLVQVSGANRRGVTSAGASTAEKTPALTPRRDWVCMIAAGASLLTAALFAIGPSTTPTADLLGWAGVSLLVAGVSAVAPLTWSRPAAVLSLFSLLAWTLLALARPFDVLSLLPTTARPDRADLDLSLPSLTDSPAPWTAVVAAVVVGAVAAALLRHVPTTAAREPTGRALVALGPGFLALGGATAVLETEPTLLVAVLVWAGALAVAGAMAVAVRDHDVALVSALVFAAYLVVAGLRLAVPSHLLAAALATAVALVLALGHARARGTLLYGVALPVLAGGSVVLAGFAATHWPYLAGGHGNAAGLSLAGVAAAVLLVARLAGRDEPSRITLEVTALVAGLAATAFPDEPTVTAMVLTILGSAVAAVAVLNRDRDEVAWIGVALLGVATMIRLVEDVRAPEGYTLPAAALLLGAGWWRLRSDRDLSSMRALASGLTLALVPSLLIALDEPVTVRGALVAAGGLVALAVGVGRHWAAPFVAGAGTTAVLAVRHLGPVVEGLPRWISLGSVGLALLLVGITWEKRRRDLHAATRYLAELR